MSQRVSTFVGSRLREARVARRITAVALAEQVGVTPAALSLFENKGSEPRPGTLGRIAVALQLPEAFFLRADRPASETSPCFYRRLTSTTKRARESARVRLGWVRDIRSYLSKYLELPRSVVPATLSTEAPESLSFEQVEEAAAQLRTIWQMGDGPIENVIGFLESKGLCISRFALGAEDLDGFSQLENEIPFVVLNSEKHNAVRSRFDAAHELGHLVLHWNVPANRAASASIHKLMESQAHRFAGAFLFPPKAFLDQVYSLQIETLIAVKRTWRVSMQMMARRALDLQLVSERQYERACFTLSRRGFRLHEPLDDELLEENPTVLRRGLEMLVEQAGIKRADILYQLPFSPADIEILTQLPRGYLSGDSMGELVPLKPRALPSDSTIGSGDVVPFRK
jgi:Zn-dependent peptidase ImmA (M78 family)/DNA-binding Xre family transcriptional regulator